MTGTYGPVRGRGGAGVTVPEVFGSLPPRRSPQQTAFGSGNGVHRIAAALVGVERRIVVAQWPAGAVDVGHALRRGHHARGVHLLVAAVGAGRAHELEPAVPVPVHAEEQASSV